MNESVYEKIIRKSGMKPVSCKCQLCKSQCRTPCFGIPDDMKKIIEAGYINRVQIRVIDDVPMITPMMQV